MTNYNKFSEKSSHIADFYQLYGDSFPDCERREWYDELSLMASEPRFHAMQACDDGRLVGFVTYWSFDACSYIEHLAVAKSWRCKGIGGQLLERVASQGKPVLLEVEPPDDEVTRRRVDFYHRHGLVLHSGIDYLQPPYAPGLPSVPMCIMTSPEMGEDDVRAVIEILRHDVYRQR